MNIFAIDLGNKRVKMKSDRGEYNFPSAYLNAENVGTRGIAGIPAEGNLCYQVKGEETHSFIWGTNLGIYNLSEKIIDTYARSERIKQKKVQRLLKFALGRLASDYKESRKKPLVVHLMLGVPITDLHHNNETVVILKELLIGQHTIQIDGEEIMVDIPNDEYISVVPQYMGTVLEISYDENMNRIEDYAQGHIGIFDIGGGTILINSTNHMAPSPIGTENFEGVDVLFKEIASRVNSTKKFIIEETLRSGSLESGYIYSPNHNEKDQQDITMIVEAAMETYTRFTIAPLITGEFPDLEEIDTIIITGGGANLVLREVLREEIGETYFSRLKFIDNSEQANVRGYYKGAYLLWDNTQEYQMNVEPLEIIANNYIETAIDSE